MDLDKEIDRLEQDLAFAEDAKHILGDPVVMAWFETKLVAVAKALCVEACRSPKSNADRNAASGIIRFVERKRAELDRYSNAEFIEKLRKKLEDLYGRRDRGGKRPRIRDLPFGEF